VSIPKSHDFGYDPLVGLLPRQEMLHGVGQHSARRKDLAWLKAVVGFMNSDGGILLIGVSDDGEILGLDADNFANEDKCRLHFKNLINTYIGVEFTRFISLFVNIEKKASCLSSVNVYDDRFSSALGKTKTFSFVPAHQTQNCQ
jgi:hypothetical protein